MKEHTSEKIRIYDTDIILYNSKRGWAIVIMPNNIRIDNHHGFEHLHFSLKGKKHEITEKNMDTLINIIITNVEKNKELNLNELKEDLL
jgi:hypothetical protein